MIFAPLVLVTMIALKILRNVIQLTEHVKLLPVLLTTLIRVKTLINSALTICALLVQKQEVLNVQLLRHAMTRLEVAMLILAIQTQTPQQIVRHLFALLIPCLTLQSTLLQELALFVLKIVTARILATSATSMMVFATIKIALKTLLFALSTRLAKEKTMPKSALL
jgi:hypothetical protein